MSARRPPATMKRKPIAEQGEADHHLERGARLLAALGEDHPERGEDGAKSTITSGFTDWIHAGGDVEAQHVEVGVVRGEEVHRTARLLVARPEDGDEEDDDEERDHPLALLAAGCRAA